MCFTVVVPNIDTRIGLEEYYIRCLLHLERERTRWFMRYEKFSECRNGIDSADSLLPPSPFLPPIFSNMLSRTRSQYLTGMREGRFMDSISLVNESGGRKYVLQ